MDRASGLLEDMRESSVEPDIITYSTIVKGYCLEGDVERAFNVLEDMKGDDKFAPDEIMYNSILDGCAKQHRVDDALRLLEEMKSTGVIPSNHTLSILVKLLGRCPPPPGRNEVHRCNPLQLHLEHFGEASRTCTALEPGLQVGRGVNSAAWFSSKR